MKSNQEILNNILQAIEPIDFRVKSNMKSEKERMHDKHYLINTIDEILRNVEEQHLGICMHNNSFYVYNGEFWSILSEKELIHFLGDAAHKLSVEKFDARYYQFKQKLFHQFLADAKIPVKEIDKSKVAINLLNGTFEIKNNTLLMRDFDPSDFLTYQLPFNFEANAIAPLFTEYLNRVLPDEELQSILAEFVGYIFLRDLKLEKCLLLYGGGANGKSVFFDIINELLGRDNISTLNMGNLNDPNGRVQIIDKLLNYGSELNAQDLRTETLKQIISGEPIECKILYRDKFQSSDYARLMFNCNELPLGVQHNEAYFRRFLIIPFNVTIPESERNPKLAQTIIQNELPGVFNWVLDGLKRLMANHAFSESKAAKEALNAYKINSDSVALYFEENNIIKSATSCVRLNNLYEGYAEFCKENGMRACSNIKFSNRLVSLGFEKQRKQEGNYVYADFVRKDVKIFSSNPSFLTSSTSKPNSGLFMQEILGDNRQPFE